ncbi:hypothetical protein LTR84_003204 [Exophiala bonariae]|uniref:Uncharacterized protein n=1 Tax=Exophiala bonariae TaxID=1690606 RepID=A0AAV9NC45_9EURO|nr:hypothetical protein LTR84_003204 [Exophiala bonariae]
MAVSHLGWSSLVSIVYFALALAGDDGGWESKSTCQPVTTTVYSVSTLYYEKTVWSTNLVYLTDTVTKVQVESTTIPVPTTIVNQQTITQVDLSTVVNQQTVTQVDLSTIVNQLTTTVISNVPGPTTTVSACPTTPLDGLVTCTSRIVNPTYTAKHPLPSDYLWGCPPGKLCTPPQIGCNFEQNPPADSYVCAPEECQDIPEIVVPEDFVNASWPNPTDADCAWYTPNPGDFNLNPEHFGLSFDIFNIYGQEVCVAPPPPPPTTTTTTTGWADWNSPLPTHTYTPRMARRGVRSWNPLAQIARRQQVGIAPKECYRTYNSANLIGTHVGYVPDILCPYEGEFMVAIRSCQACAATYSTTSDSTTDFPDLQRYYAFCEARAANATTAR